MNIYSIDYTKELNNLELTKLSLMKNNNYKSKINLNDKEIYIEYPKCKIKPALCISNNSFIDLEYDNSLNNLNNWISDLEKILSNKIYEKNNEWFTNPINKNIINNMITPLYRKYKQKLLIRCYINVGNKMNINELENKEIIPIIKLDSLIVKSNSFDIKLLITKIKRVEEKNIIKEVDLVINEETPIKLKKHNEVYINYYKETINKAELLRDEAINKYLEAQKIKSTIYNLKDILNIDENKEIDNLNKEIDKINI
jgi:hypothetical protein